MFYLLLVQVAIKIPSVFTILKSTTVRSADYLVGNHHNDVYMSLDAQKTAFAVMVNHTRGLTLDQKCFLWVATIFVVFVLLIVTHSKMPLLMILFVMESI